MKMFVCRSSLQIVGGCGATEIFIIIMVLSHFVVFFDNCFCTLNASESGLQHEIAFILWENDCIETVYLWLIKNVFQLSTTARFFFACFCFRCHYAISIVSMRWSVVLLCDTLIKSRSFSKCIRFVWHRPKRWLKIFSVYNVTWVKLTEPPKRTNETYEISGHTCFWSRCREQTHTHAVRWQTSDVSDLSLFRTCRANFRCSHLFFLTSASFWNAFFVFMGPFVSDWKLRQHAKALFA